MVSLRFPFSFSQLPNPPHTPSSSILIAGAVSVAAVATAVAGLFFCFPCSLFSSLLIADIIEKKELVDDLVESDISMTVRLQIIYSKLIIRSVCSVFEESVGSRLQKFGDQIKENCFKKNSFLSQFHHAYCLFDGKEVGSMESKHLYVLGSVCNRIGEQLKITYYNIWM
ncbi:hypothetical protein UlMin_015998 [Ulmus minor]